LLNPRLVLAGMATLLGLLETGHTSVQPLILSVMADLFKVEVLAMECFRDWVSSFSLRSGVQLLLDLWRDAEGEWGVCENGLLTNTKKPLAGQGKRSLWVPKQEV
jgi:hypothetical protein